MARYTGPVCRICRREGTKLHLKGERCYSDKCSVERRAYPPGAQGAEGKRGKLSEYGQQLREKQKVKRSYGLVEKQFRGLFGKAVRLKGVTAENFFRDLELRLDNVIFRMGMARSRSEARQLVRHNHVIVNGKRNNIPSTTLRVGDLVDIAEKSKTKSVFKLANELYGKRVPLAWFEVDHSKQSGKITAVPTREDIQLLVKDRMIVEHYSK